MLTYLGKGLCPKRTTPSATPLSYESWEKIQADPTTVPEEFFKGKEVSNGVQDQELFPLFTLVRHIPSLQKIFCSTGGAVQAAIEAIPEVFKKPFVLLNDRAEIIQQQLQKDFRSSSLTEFLKNLSKKDPSVFLQTSTIDDGEEPVVPTKCINIKDSPNVIVQEIVREDDTTQPVLLHDQDLPGYTLKGVVLQYKEKGETAVLIQKRDGKFFYCNQETQQEINTLSHCTFQRCASVLVWEKTDFTAKGIEPANFQDLLDINAPTFQEYQQLISDDLLRHSYSSRATERKNGGAAGIFLTTSSKDQVKNQTTLLTKKYRFHSCLPDFFVQVLSEKDQKIQNISRSGIQIKDRNNRGFSQAYHVDTISIEQGGKIQQFQYSNNEKTWKNRKDNSVKSLQEITTLVNENPCILFWKGLGITKEGAEEEKKE